MLENIILKRDEIYYSTNTCKALRNKSRNGTWYLWRILLLFRNVQEDLNKKRVIPCSLIGWFSVTKVSVLSNLISRFNAVLFLKKIFFNWRVIALPCCVGFCHTTTQVSPTYICLIAVLIKISTLIFMEFDKQSKVLYITKKILKMQNKKSSVFPDSRAYCTHHISEGSVVLVLV